MRAPAAASSLSEPVARTNRAAIDLPSVYSYIRDVQRATTCTVSTLQGCEVGRWRRLQERTSKAAASRRMRSVRFNALAFMADKRGARYIRAAGTMEPCPNCCGRSALR